MSQGQHPVATSLNGVFYEIPCAPGEAPRVRELAQRLDQRLRDLAAASGAADNSQLLLLAALTLQDEQETLALEVRNLRAELARCAPVQEGGRDQRLAEALLSAAERISAVAEKLDAA